MDHPRYIDPTSDFGFKRIFASEPNKDLLIAFINGLFRERKTIVDLTYDKNEFVGDTEELGAVVLDSLNFSTWNWLILLKAKESWRATWTGGCLYLRAEVLRHVGVLKNMSGMDKLPVYLRKPVFEKLFAIAEYSKLNKEERDMYDVSLKRKWDKAAVLAYAREEGIKEGMEKGIEQGIEEGMEKGIAQGIEKGRMEERARAEAEKLAEKRASALELKKMGITAADIAKAMGLSVEEVERLG